MVAAFSYQHQPLAVHRKLFVRAPCKIPAAPAIAPSSLAPGAVAPVFFETPTVSDGAVAPV